MEKFYGQFEKYKWKNEKTGLASFTVKSDGKQIRCEGVTTPLTHKIPLIIEGEYRDDEVFEIKDCTMCGYNKEVMIEYLCTPSFKKVGDSIATKIVNNMGSDIFGIARKYSDVNDAITRETVCPETAQKILTTIKEKTDFEALLKHILNLGGAYYNAVKMIKNLRMNTLYAVEKNPYLMLYSEVPIKIVEKEAKKQGIKSYDNKRIAAVVGYVLDSNESQGNTKITFHELLERIHKNEKDSGYNTNMIHVAAELTKERYEVQEEDGDFYIYKRSTYQTEKDVAENIKRLQTSKIELLYKKEDVEQIETSLGITYSKEQKDAFEILKTSGVKIITGGPGTGKTTFLNGCIRLYTKYNPNIKISLCAPTGCAAAKMHDSTNLNATTIHKLLGLTADTTSTPAEELNSDVIIVDEFSMVGVSLFNKLLNAVKNGSSLILLGDKDQLPSIDEGNVLEDLIESGFIETHNFKQIFRQKNGNSIISNAHKVINGDKSLETDPNFTIKRFDNEDDITGYLQHACAKSKSDYTVFTGAKKVKFPTGSIKLNQLVKEAKAKDKESITFGYYTFAENDKVIFNKNNYDKNYYNGEVGYITSIQKISDFIKVAISADGETIYLEDAELNDIELGYVLTAHKAQGSECENAIIVIPQNPANMLQRKLLYVEITRAKKNVFIISEGNALEKCVINKNDCKRVTGLQNHLRRIFT